MGTNPDSENDPVQETKATQNANAIEEKTKIHKIFVALKSSDTPEAQPEKPKTGLDKQVEAIFNQASLHRDKLLTFFIYYTIWFTVFVIIVIIFQASIRAFVPGKEEIELIPYWALNLLLVGMFGQFIALLTIVTKKVWQLEEFFKQAVRHNNNPTAHTEKKVDKREPDDI